MKRYKKYMDSVRVSDTLHQRLTELEEPVRHPAWKKYGAMAAALVLVAGLGAWRLSDGCGRRAASLLDRVWPGPDWSRIEEDFRPDSTLVVEPGEADQSGEKTVGGYEVRGEGSGPDAEVTYYVLPYIEYGDTGGVEACLDWDIPKGAARRDLSRDEIVTLMGGTEAVNTHLNWSGYELSGWAAWYEDGAFWGTYVHGYQGPLDHFEFAVTAGQRPPTCVVYPGSVEQEIQGLTVTADRFDGKDGCDRRVSFMRDDYGYCFDLTATDVEQAELLVSRLVRLVADEGLGLYSVDGTADVCDPEPDCDDAGFDGGVETAPFAPPEAEKPYDNAPSTYICEVCGKSVLEDDVHFHLVPNGDGTYTCDSCGTTMLEGEEHYHETEGDYMCEGLPVPPSPEPGETYICPVCEKTLPKGIEHSHELCGYPLAPDGLCGLPLAPEGFGASSEAAAN